MAQRTDLASTLSSRDTPTERSAFAIRQDIAAKRESISETVDKLEQRIHKTFDWHEYVGSYPAVALGLAAGAGFLVAGIFRRKPTPQERILDAFADLTDDLTSRVGDAMAGVIQNKLVSGRTLKAAATTLVAKAAVNYVTSRLSASMTGNNHPSSTVSSSNAFDKPNTDLQPSGTSASVVED
jgi:ElaB/YqjD/DUF883 family membrane-anchored ribosome-binding protein